MPFIAACIISEPNATEARPVFYELGLTTSLGKSGDQPKVQRGIDRRQGTERYVNLNDIFVTTQHQVSLTITLPRWKRFTNLFGKIWVAFSNYRPKERVPEDPVNGIPAGRVRVKYKVPTAPERERKIKETINQLIAHE
ncbi:hypothetical protein DFH09DRAFT_1293114 [Mycena vulgaris]|nr:hypothetical protein DFH09DRAFT_1293114 [Mycena vulgaris]